MYKKITPCPRNGKKPKFMDCFFCGRTLGEIWGLTHSVTPLEAPMDKCEAHNEMVIRIRNAMNEAFEKRNPGFNTAKP